MRLWHYELLKYLPNLQIIAQWRELNSIYKKQDNHILINYVYEYDKNALYLYSLYVIDELQSRGIKIKSYSNLEMYFEGYITEEQLIVEVGNYSERNINPFPKNHTDRYLKQCFYNLQEKYDRGQKDFTKEIYEELEDFCLTRSA